MEGQCKCPAVLSLLDPLIIPQVFAGQLTDAAGKWCQEPDFGFCDFNYGQFQK